MSAQSSVPDSQGRFGPYGGRYVPETLMAALHQLTEHYEQARADPEFQKQLDYYLRDYVFVPLADMRWTTRRHRIAQHFLAIIATMALCGLWHGANFTFVIWGALQGAAMVFATLWSRHFRPPPAWTGWAATFAFCVIVSVFFRSPNVGYAFHYLTAMFSFSDGSGARAQQITDGWHLPADGLTELLIAGGCLALLAMHWLEAQLFTRRALVLIRAHDGMFLRALFAGAALWLLLLPKAQDNPFIYFRF